MKLARESGNDLPKMSPLADRVSHERVKTETEPQIT